MKKILALAFLLFGFFTANAQTGKYDPRKKLLLAEASCGQCQFGLNSKPGCALAVRIDGKSYFVDGAKIDDFGDAHAADGFCEAVRNAEVQGKVVNGRFKTTYFKLLPETKN